ncbi:MAG: hypothetical protein KF878_30480 [Planctomycetes bacterium]|nr:hypothetical protein [Planctomycetota bacterium]
MVGSSFRKLGLGRLAELVLPSDDHAALLALREALGAEELVYLATCNRVECHALLRAPAAPDALAARAAAFFRGRGASADAAAFVAVAGLDAVERLFAVTSSLDSLVLGETGVARQVRLAADRAATSGLSGPTLGRVFDRAAVCARRVHARSGLARASRSVAAMALEKVRARFGPEGPGVTVLVGAGETIREVARALAGLPGERLVVNRSIGAAEALAREVGGRALSLERFLLEPPAWIDLLVSATAATEVVIPAWALGPALAARARALSRRPLVVCDLALPRDVDPAIDDVPGVQVLSLERLEAMQRAKADVSEEVLTVARRLVRQEALGLLREERFRRVAAESAAALVADRLAHLEVEDRELVVRFAGRLAERLASHARDSSCW